MAKKSLHEKLNLSFAELGALLGTQRMIKDNLIVHATGEEARIDNIGDKHIFNMEISCCKNESCGSVACIGGTMGQIMFNGNAATASMYVSDMRSSGRPIEKLFFPPEEYNYTKITARHALKAIANFLKTGKPQWKKILPKSILERDDI